MSKYEEAKRDASYSYSANLPSHTSCYGCCDNDSKHEIAFRHGSDFGANYERERSLKLVEALKLVSNSIEHISDDQFIVMNRSGIERAIKTLASYESKDFILDQEKGEL